MTLSPGIFIPRFECSILSVLLYYSILSLPIFKLNYKVTRIVFERNVEFELKNIFGRWRANKEARMSNLLEKLIIRL